jgi:ribosome-binding protein aMBF1 (putative translation factor)
MNNNNLSHQDWNVVKFHNNQPKPTGEVRTKNVNNKPGSALEKDLFTSANEEAPNLKALPKLSNEDKQAMIKARCDKKMSQKDLANTLNCNIKIIQDLEAGKVLTGDKQILVKINRQLGTKLKFNQ